MELLAFLFLWPFLILAIGLVFIAAGDLFLGAGAGFGVGTWLVALIAAFFVIRLMSSSSKKAGQAKPMAEQLDELKRGMIIFSIGLLLPIFLRYLVEAFNKSLGVIIVGLVIAFGLAGWGMFMKRQQVLMYSNIMGGLLSLLYLYAQLWQLGEGARIIATAFGLVVAVGLSIIKLKDKLV